MTDTPEQPSRALAELLAFESLIGETLPRFVSLPSDQIDAAIVEAQRRIVETLDLDRSTLFSVAENGSISSSHCWHRPDTAESTIGLVASTMFPGCAAKARRGEEVIYSSVADLPPDFRGDAAQLSVNGPKSSAAFPLMVGGRLIAVLAFGALRNERQWPEPIVRRLRLMASVFGSALSRKQSDDAREEKSSWLRLAADSADAALWTVDTDGRIWATDKAFQIYGIGYDPNLTIDQFLRVVHPEDRDAVRDAVLRSQSQGEEFVAEYRIVLPSGTVRWINARGRMQAATALRGERLMGVSIDVTDRKSIEQELIQSLAETKRLKDRLAAESDYLAQAVKLAHGHDRIVGQSYAIRRSLSQVDVVAPANTNVLLIGETGTGKELFASAIHDGSGRSARTMIRVNCGAIPATLIESELFGREKGAYTGALSKQVGRFELAHQSTLFLDEIGELPPELQVRLLRVLEEKKISRLGSPRQIDVDFRLVAATNRDLEKAVAQGTFREDLYYRLNVFQIRIPPLRERPEDIPLLVRAFVGEFAAAQGKQIDSIDQDDMEALQRYDWPGNVRELRNVIERAVIVAAGPRLRIDAPSRRPHLPGSAAQSVRMEDVERAHILAVLDRTGWRIRGKGGAAELLDIKPTTLEARMDRLGISRADKQAPARLQDSGGTPTYWR